MNEKPHLTTAGIKRVVADHFDVTIAELDGKCREWRIVFPRFVAYWLVRELMGFTLVEIGRQFGKDHGSVLNGIGAIKDLLRNRDRTSKGLVLLKESLEFEFDTNRIPIP